MKIVAKTVLLAMSLLLSAGSGFAADVNNTAKAAGSAVVSDVKSPAVAVAKDAAKGVLIDINSATDAELKGISGVGEAYAAKIVAGRPYAAKNQLKSRKIIPAPLYEQIKDAIIAKQPAAKEKGAVKPVGKK